MKKVTTEINERKRHLDNQKKISDLEEKLVGKFEVKKKKKKEKTFY
jgi:hypothetical protein